MYTTLDDTSEVFDLIPMLEFLIENTTDPHRRSFLLTGGVYKFRVGVRARISSVAAEPLLDNVSLVVMQALKASL